jgi:hypothetical protein
VRHRQLQQEQDDEDDHLTPIGLLSDTPSYFFDTYLHEKNIGPDQPSLVLSSWSEQLGRGGHNQ